MIEMKNQIRIVTGPIQSGKTTRLFKFVNTQTSVDGILSPIVNDKRVLYHIGSRTIKEFEVNSFDKNIIEVGKYKFLQASFDWGNKILIAGLRKNPEWLIIDEVGKLELQEKGFHNSLKLILTELEIFDTKLVLVIRDYLMKETIIKYNLDQFGYEIMEI